LGVRFSEIRDFTEVESARPGFPNGGIYNPKTNCGDFLTAVGTLVEGPTQQSVIRDHYDTRNNLVGGQLGTRIVKQRGRWNLTGDAKAFGLQNFQWVTRKYEVTVIDYDAALAEVDRQTSRCEQSDRFSEFAIGMEIRAEAAYEVTRDITLRSGLELLHYFRGIARGADSLQPVTRGGQNTENLTAVGITFGIAVNR
jgi:hypothetical protein